MAAPLSEKNANVMMDVTMQAQMLHDGDEEPQCQDQHGPAKKVKSMEYHRQVLSGRLAQAKADGYASLSLPTLSCNSVPQRSLTLTWFCFP